MPKANYLAELFSIDGQVAVVTGGGGDVLESDGGGFDGVPVGCYGLWHGFT